MSEPHLSPGQRACGSILRGHYVITRIHISPTRVTNVTPGPEGQGEPGAMRTETDASNLFVAKLAQHLKSETSEADAAVCQGDLTFMLRSDFPEDFVGDSV